MDAAAQSGLELAIAANAEQARALEQRLREHELQMAALKAEGERLQRQHKQLQLKDAELRQTLASGRNEALALFDLPDLILARILLSATTHDKENNLLRFVAACAQVSKEWWRVLQGTAAYGAGLSTEIRDDLSLGFGSDDEEETPTERAKVLRAISKALCEPRGRFDNNIHLSGVNIGGAGIRTLAAAIQAMPAPLPFGGITLGCCGITAADMPHLAPIFQREFAGEGLQEVSCWGHKLGDDGVSGLAVMLPSTIRTLGLSLSDEVGDAGMAALVATLPRLTKLESLDLRGFRGITTPGWAALGATLARMRTIKTLDVGNCGPEVLELVPFLPDIALLEMLQIDTNQIDDTGAHALAAVLPRCDFQGGREYMEIIIHDNTYGDAGKAALDQAVHGRAIEVTHAYDPGDEG